MVLKHTKVAIIGAGPIGLTLARLLQQNGVDVTVYERDKDAHARIWGGTLDLMKESGQKALEKAGLLQRYFALGIAMGRTIADEQGNVLFERKPTPEAQYDSPEINRNQLRGLLLDSLTSNTVIWDRKVTGLEQQSGKWQLQFDNKPDAIADVVIGSNGGTSNIRPYLTDTQIEATGTYFIQGEVLDPQINCPAFYQLCDTNILMCSHQGNHLVANPNNNGALTYNAMFSVPANWVDDDELNFKDPDSIRAFLTYRYSDWGESYQQVFRATSTFWGLPTKKLPLDKPWSRNRALPVTLVGDAAHLMPPFAGQGVNTGLMDASVLADSLLDENHATIQAAIDEYEQKMFVYAKQAQHESSANEVALRHPDFSFLKLMRRYSKNE